MELVKNEEWFPFTTPSGRVMEKVSINSMEDTLRCDTCGLEMAYHIEEDRSKTVLSMNGHMTGHKRKAKLAKEKEEEAKSTVHVRELDALAKAHEEELRAQTEYIHILQTENGELKDAILNYVLASEAVTDTVQVLENYKYEAAEWKKRLFNLIGDE